MIEGQSVLEPTLPRQATGKVISLFCSILGCDLPLQKVALRQCPPTFSVLFYLLQKVVSIATELTALSKQGITLLPTALFLHA